MDAVKMISLLLLLGTSPSLHAQNPDSLFRSAGEFYQQARYEEAADAYERIIALGKTNYATHFNLANTYYRLGFNGKAVVHYHRALRFEPGDPDATFNLQLALLRTRDRIEPVPEVFLVRWLKEFGSLLSPDAASILFIIFWIVLAASLTMIFSASGEWIFRLSRAMTLAGILVVITTGSMMLIQTGLLDTPRGVIISQSVTAKSSPDAGSVNVFVVHEGLTVDLKDEVGNWQRVVLPDGKEGWVQKNNLERI